MHVSEETKQRILTDAGLPPGWIDESDVKPTESDLMSAATIVMTAPSRGAMGVALAHMMADTRHVVEALVGRIAELEAANR